MARPGEGVTALWWRCACSRNAPAHSPGARRQRQEAVSWAL